VFQTRRSEFIINIVCAEKPGPSFDHNEDADKCIQRTGQMN
jgi:hypothetical protein